MTLGFFRLQFSEEPLFIDAALFQMSLFFFLL